VLDFEIYDATNDPPRVQIRVPVIDLGQRVGGREELIKFKPTDPPQLQKTRYVFGRAHHAV
jgi:hypothetical protein